MAATITSNTETDEQLAAQFVDFGNDVVVRGTVTEEAKPPVEEKKPESKEESGDKSAATPDGKTETGKSEPVETQEVPPGESKEEKRAKGGYQRRIEKLTLQLEEEGEDKARIKGELRELRAKLAALEAPVEKPVEEGAKAGPVKPKRPPMPQLSDFDYDADKFGAALKKYNTVDMEAYDEALTAFLNASVEKQLQEDRARQVEEQQRLALVQKVKSGTVDYPDYQSLYDSLPEKAVFPTDECPAVNHFIAAKSKHPTALYRYFIQDYLENEAAEGKRIAAMDEFDQILELKEIENRLAAERAAKKPAEKKPETPKEPPAPPKQPVRKVPDEPIETVGGHGANTSTAGTLEQQFRAAAESGNSREALRLETLLRKQNWEAKQRR